MKEEEVVVGPGGGLKNVVVRVTKGVVRPLRRRPPRPRPSTRAPCMYRPRVQGIVARAAAPDQEQRPDAAQHPRLQGRVDAVQPGGDPGPAADDQAVQRRRPDREAQVRRPPVDDRLRAGVEPTRSSRSRATTAASRSPACRRAATRSRRGTSATAQKLRRSPSPPTSRTRWRRIRRSKRMTR